MTGFSVGLNSTIFFLEKKHIPHKIGGRFEPPNLMDTHIYCTWVGWLVGWLVGTNQPTHRGYDGLVVHLEASHPWRSLLRFAAFDAAGLTP